MYKANVQWWNNDRLSVRCPLYREIHNHGFNNNFTSKNTRSSHYIRDSYLSYKLCFPLGDVPGEVGYELDKEHAMFVAAEADPRLYALEVGHGAPT